MKKAAPKPKAAKAGRRRIDWEAAERDYRTGKYSQRELAAIHGTNEATLCRKVKKDQALDQTRWQRDLTEEVRQATNARLMSELVKSEVKEGQEKVKESIKVAAEINAKVILRHQGDVLSLRNLAMEMAGELSLATHSPEELEGLFRQATAGLDAESMTAVQQSFKDMLKLHSRVGSLHKLSETLNKLQALERKAFGLDDDSGGGGEGFEDLVRDLPEAQS